MNLTSSPVLLGMNAITMGRKNHLLKMGSGQIIAASHDLTAKCNWGRDIHLFQGKGAGEILFHLATKNGMILHVGELDGGSPLSKLQLTRGHPKMWRL